MKHIRHILLTSLKSHKEYNQSDFSVDHLVMSMYRDITLPTKVRLVKAMVFPVVMYGCKTWTINKAESEELMLLNCGVGEDS